MFHHKCTRISDPNTVKDLARLLHARSLHQSAGNFHCSGVKDLSGPTKGATEAACRPVPEGRNGGKVKLICLVEMIYIVKRKATHLFTELPLLCWIVTALGGLFGEYHSSSAALGQQRPEVTKQPLVCDWLATPETLMMLNCHRSKYRGRFVQGWIKYSKKTWLDYSLRGLCT